MKKITMYSLAAMIAVGGFAGFGFQSVKTASADQTYQPEVLISSSQVRFEAQATGYDEATNKYKYKFSWLMPKGKTYSFKIDGNMYQSKVTQNAVIETPFWFSPDITYTIQIYPYANGKGSLLAQGTFKVPAKPAAALTEEQEYQLFFQYLNALPDYKSKTVKSPEDVQGIITLLSHDSASSSYTDLKPFLSKQSIYVFDQLPLLVASLDGSQGNSKDLTKYIARNIKVVQGKQYGYIKQIIRDGEDNKIYHPDLVFIKEDGQWKLDYLQYFKAIYKALGYMK